MNNNAAFFLLLAGGIGYYFLRGRKTPAYQELMFPISTPLPVDQPVKRLGAKTVIFNTPARGLMFETSFKAASNKYNIPPGMLSRIAQQESNYNPRAKSPAGAIGLMQFMPATAKDMGVDPLDPFSSIEGAGKYLRWLYDRVGSWKMALAAYNWGIGNLQRKGFEKAPQETQLYVAQITKDTGVV